MDLTHLEKDITAEMKDMVHCFRMPELAVLLGFAGKSKTGRKNVLLTRALQLIQSSQCTRSIQAKVVELYERRYPQHAAQVRQQYASLLKDQNVMQRDTSRPREPPPRTKSPPNFRIPADAPRFKPLSFYEHISEVLPCGKLVSRSSQVMRNHQFTFHVSRSHASKISSGLVKENNSVKHNVQLQLRFCLWNKSKLQDDELPPNLSVSVNRRMVVLPPFSTPMTTGTLPKRINRPIDITSLCPTVYGCDYILDVKWCEASKPAWKNESYAVTISLVKQLSVDDLIGKLDMLELLPASETTCFIKKTLAKDPDSDISTTSLKVSLSCPLGKVRINLPVRSILCNHLQCFDANLFFRMNEKKPTWVCPVCNKPASFVDLRIDELFKKILKDSRLTEVEFLADGTWKNAKKRTETILIGTPTKPIDLSKTNEVICLDDMDEKKNVVQFIDLTCDSSSDEEKKRVQSPNETPMDIGSPPPEREKLITPKIERQTDYHHSYGKTPNKRSYKDYASPSQSPYSRSFPTTTSQSHQGPPMYDLTRKTPPPRHLKQSSITSHFLRQPSKNKTSKQKSTHRTGSNKQIDATSFRSLAAEASESITEESLAIPIVLSDNSNSPPPSPTFSTGVEPPNRVSSENSSQSATIVCSSSSAKLSESNADDILAIPVMQASENCSSLPKPVLFSSEKDAFIGASSRPSPAAAITPLDLSTKASSENEEEPLAIPLVPSAAAIGMSSHLSSINTEARAASPKNSGNPMLFWNPNSTEEFQSNRIQTLPIPSSSEIERSKRQPLLNSIFDASLDANPFNQTSNPTNHSLASPIDAFCDYLRGPPLSSYSLPPELASLSPNPYNDAPARSQSPSY